jgi:hypothetical protein
MFLLMRVFMNRLARDTHPVTHHSVRRDTPLPYAHANSQRGFPFSFKLAWGDFLFALNYKREGC